MNNADRPAASTHWFTTFVDPHLPAMRAYALRQMGNEADAQDIVQDVLLKLFQQAERLQAVRDPRPWLMRVIYHQCIDLRRERGLLPSVSLPVHEDEDLDPLAHLCAPGMGPEELVQQGELQRMVLVALRSLPAAQRMALELHHLQGLSLNEIAQQYHIPLNTLKSALSRGRCNLRAALAWRLAGPTGLALQPGRRVPPSRRRRTVKPAALANAPHV